MLILPTLATLAAWSYAGFLADPTPIPVAPVVVPPARPDPAPTTPLVTPVAPPTPRPLHTPAQPPVVELPKPPPRPPATVAKPVRPKPVEPATTPDAPPTRYHLADGSGQVWEHTDPDWLRQFVAGRNQQLATAGGLP